MVTLSAIVTFHPQRVSVLKKSATISAHFTSLLIIDAARQIPAKKRVSVLKKCHEVKRVIFSTYLPVIDPAGRIPATKRVSV